MGMLSEATQQPASMPLANEQAPPTEPMPAQAAEQDYSVIKSAAIEFMYGERFDALIKMFQTSGAQGFARAVAVAINGAIGAAKKQYEFGHEQAAQLGMDLYLYLLEDMLTGEFKGEKIVKDVSMEQMQDALTQSLTLYAESNPDVTEQDMQALLVELQKQPQQPQEADNGIA